MALVNRALALNPSFARGWYISGVIKLWAGQPDVAIEHVEASMRLSPRAPIGPALGVIGGAHFFAGRFTEAVSKLRDLQALLSASVFSHSGIIDKFLGDGLMAVFGPPMPGSAGRDQCRALRDRHPAIDRRLERAMPSIRRRGDPGGRRHPLWRCGPGRYWQREAAGTHCHRRYGQYCEPRRSVLPIAWLCGAGNRGVHRFNSFGRERRPGGKVCPTKATTSCAAAPSRIRLYGVRKQSGLSTGCRKLSDLCSMVVDLSGPPSAV